MFQFYKRQPELSHAAIRSLCNCHQVINGLLEFELIVATIDRILRNDLYGSRDGTAYRNITCPRLPPMKSANAYLEFRVLTDKKFDTGWRLVVSQYGHIYYSHHYESFVPVPGATICI